MLPPDATEQRLPQPSRGHRRITRPAARSGRRGGLDQRPCRFMVGQTDCRTASDSPRVAHLQAPAPLSKTQPMWWIAGLAGLGALFTGAVSRHQAYQVAITRGAPVLGFRDSW